MSAGTCWSERERVLLEAILDQLIPANPDKGIPAAGQSGVAGFMADRMAQDAQLAGSVANVLSQAGALARALDADALRSIERHTPVDFERLLRCCYAGYYSRAQIRERIGIAPWPVHPRGYEVATESARLLDELTAPVRARGAVYRKTPAGGGRET